MSGLNFLGLLYFYAHLKNVYPIRLARKEGRGV